MVIAKCKECGKEFLTYNAWLRRGRGKFCSKLCRNKSEWVGDKPGYSSVHTWLRKTYGKATKCVGRGCNGESKVYEWALIKGKDYIKVKENFKELCKSCHKKYDVGNQQI